MKNSIALSFNKSEYYNLNEATDYLNLKHNMNSLTPKKLTKHIYNKGINTFIHYRINNLNDTKLRVTFDFNDSNLIDEFFNSEKNLSEKDYEDMIQLIKDIENHISNRLLDDLYMGYILFKVDEFTLFNMTFSKNPDTEYRLFLLDGFIHRESLNDDPYRPSQLKKWNIKKDNKIYNIDDIASICFVIDSIEEKDLNEFANKSPLSCTFDKRDDFTFAELHIRHDDLIILHKDLEDLEHYIIEDLSAVKDTEQPFKKKGVSSKLLKARLVANTHAHHLWKKDHNEEIRIGEMCELVWNYLVDTEHREVLPDNRNTLKDWITNIPEYASKAGAPKANKTNI